MHCPAACLPFHWPIKQPELYGSTNSKYINYKGRKRDGEKNSEKNKEMVEEREGEAKSRVDRKRKYPVKGNK